MIELVVAMSLNHIIGQKGSKKLMWNSKLDMQFFKGITIGKTVVMGKNTFLTLNKPLVDRNNIVLSKHLKSDEVEVISDYTDVLSKEGKFVVIGGLEIYNLFLPYVDIVYMTTISLEVNGKDLLEFPVDYISNNFFLAEESLALQDINNISGKPINLIFSRWERTKGELH